MLLLGMRGVATFLAAAGLAIAAPPAAEAATVYADPAGACNGLIPCFTTLQTAVDNASPAPATVGIFPGTYAESVDLNTMGSAVAGGGPGDITLQVLDAGGSPATNGVLVDPGAPGGPGSGVGLSAGPVGMSGFPGAISLRGLAITSPDTVGMGIFAVGDLELRDLLLEGCGLSGGFATTEGTLTVADVTARLNVENGLTAGGTQATVEDVLVTRNGSDGGLFFALDSLVVRRVEATANDATGLAAVSCGTLEIEDVTADTNGGTGAGLSAGFSSFCEPASSSAALAERLEQSSPIRELESKASPSLAPVVLFDEAALAPALMTVSGLSAAGNGGEGATAFVEAGSAVMDDVVASGNQGWGLQTFVERDLQLSHGSFTDNVSGLQASALRANVSQVVASDNTPATPTAPFEGSGAALLLVEGGDIVDVEAERNAVAGLLLAGGLEDIPVTGPYRIQNGRMAENDEFGIASVFGLVDVQITGTEVVGNTLYGISLPSLRLGSIQDVLATGNAFGINADVAASLEIRESEISTNRTGIFLGVQPDAVAKVHCSNLRGNTPGPALRLAAGLEADARANFWGDPSGPTHPANPGGTGDEVTDGATIGTGVVDYSGWLAAEATADDCIDPSVLEIPTTGGLGLALLAGLLGLAGFAALRWL